MNIIEQIMEAVCELQAMDCKDKDLIICYSPLVERYLRQNLFETQYPVYRNDDFQLKRLMGIETSDKWPYNEIVVYDTMNVAYYPNLLKKIVLENVTFGIPQKVL